MAVIIDGIEATRRVDYDAPELVEIGERAGARTAAHRGALGVDVPEHDGRAHQRPVRPGLLRGPRCCGPSARAPSREAPVLPGVGLFMPPGTGAAKDKGLFRREVPGVPPGRLHRLHGLRPGVPGRRDPEHACTRCTTCSSPRSAGSRPPPARRTALRPAVYGIAERTREALRHKDERPFSRGRGRRGGGPARRPRDVARRRPPGRRGSRPTRSRGPGRSSTRRRRRSRAPVGSSPPPSTRGSAPGCLECIDVCGPGALTVLEQDADVLATLQQRFELHERHPQHAEPVRRGLGHPGRRHQAAHARPRQLLRDDRRPRRLPRLRRGHRHPARHVDRRTRSASGAAASTSRS